MKVRFLDNRTRMLAYRPWTEKERQVVMRGVWGRSAIAIEPFLGCVVFAFFTWGIIVRANAQPDHSLIVIAPLFALASVAFGIYMVAVMFAPLRALAQTYRPIFIVDGYVRYREPDEHCDDDAIGYVAALFEDKTVACEWEWPGTVRLENRTIPARIEFSVYGGIHKIDGINTGVLPEHLPTLAIGIAPRH